VQDASYCGYHQTRFRENPKRELVWQVLWERYFSRLVSSDGSVLDLGAGYGHFIKQVRCARRYALDQWPGMLDHLPPGVEGVVGRVDDLGFLADSSLDLVLASNLFEHLERAQLLATLGAVRRKLRPTGSLVVLQPNYRFAYREYFDDYTHVAVFSDRSLRDLLEAEGFRVVEAFPRFLPLTVESRWPVFKPLVRAYLASPLKPFGKQMLLRATPAVDGPERGGR
jgi:SAM-dependent methyltransferase